MGTRAPSRHRAPAPNSWSLAVSLGWNGRGLCLARPHHHREGVVHPAGAPRPLLAYHQPPGERGPSTALSRGAVAHSPVPRGRASQTWCFVCLLPGVSGKPQAPSPCSGFPEFTRMPWAKTPVGCAGHWGCNSTDSCPAVPEHRPELLGDPALPAPPPRLLRRLCLDVGPSPVFRVFPWPPSPSPCTPPGLSLCASRILPSGLCLAHVRGRPPHRNDAL